MKRADTRPLTPGEMSSAEFAHLMWLAVEVGDDELARMTRDDLATLTTLGAVEDGRVIAFVAFDPSVDPVAIEYIAVDESAQGRGYGAALVNAVRRATPGRSLVAETDDDAVEFYRRIGFAVTRQATPDPRWPDRQRYECTLA